jgi:hypothetical protein
VIAGPVSVAVTLDSRGNAPSVTKIGQRSGVELTFYSV